MMKILTTMSPNLLLLLAIIFEVIATSLLPKTQQFSQPLISAIVLICYALAFFLLSVTIKSVPIGIAYAIWCGAGIILVTVISWLWYGQQLDWVAILGISLILLGSVIINIFSTTISH
ncbi:QacE family quaternary ammonium compound efflux SMR transporter [Moritella marina ATCC 15381]|uniref:QacE family quaternary ammonium compound efflux SMR transporter n=1 Tax=Moritella marina ATCC 15381 TaxID=1202962 RepID=A0A5J6WSQ6_MORMI|nr:SMR family transporter [Moritella marina]QFI39975.1 QacE family quaternary ammonium compound efflux SMR transporter [Moritella marina ATCC 15381]